MISEQPATSTIKLNHGKKFFLCIWEEDMKYVLYYELLNPSETVRVDAFGV